MYSVSSPLYLNAVWWSWHERNNIENDFEYCRITVLAAGAYIEQLGLAVFYLVWVSDRCRGRTIQYWTISNKLSINVDKMEIFNITNKIDGNSERQCKAWRRCSETWEFLHVLRRLMEVLTILYLPKCLLFSLLVSSSCNVDFKWNTAHRKSAILIHIEYSH